MKLVRTILVDDEFKAISVLEDKLKSYFTEIEIIGIANTSEEAFELITRLKPELVYLDIALPGENSIEMLKRMPKHEFELIFVTGMNQFALDAIKLCAVGYVMKPILSEDLIKATQIALDRIHQKVEHNRIKQLIENLSTPVHQNHRIGISGKDGIHFLSVHEIIRCEGWDGYTKIICADGKVLISSQNIGEYKSLLINYYFFDVHKSHLVNLRAIEFYDRKQDEIKMKDGSLIPIARRQKSQLTELLLKSR
ncbi:MAG: LytTR family DNA-binding domain-containing protein [Bacteroidota bacterium]|nr:LytTR family DNA-binding domain-containing protein [Bacteroidota bacterium]